MNAPRGSCFNHDPCEKQPLGAEVEAAHQTSQRKLLGMQAVPSDSACSPRKPSYNPNGGTDPIPSDCSRLRGTHQLRDQTPGRGKNLSSPYACSLTRRLYLELLPNLETEEFLGRKKRLSKERQTQSDLITTMEEPLSEQPSGSTK